MTKNQNGRKTSKKLFKTTPWVATTAWEWAIQGVPRKMAPNLRQWWEDRNFFPHSPHVHLCKQLPSPFLKASSSASAPMVIVSSTLASWLNKAGYFWPWGCPHPSIPMNSFKKSITLNKHDGYVLLFVSKRWRCQWGRWFERLKKNDPKNKSKYHWKENKHLYVYTYCPNLQTKSFMETVFSRLNVFVFTALRPSPIFVVTSPIFVVTRSLGGSTEKIQLPPAPDLDANDDFPVVASQPATIEDMPWYCWWTKSCTTWDG